MGGTGKPSLSRLALGLVAIAEDRVRGTLPADRPDLGRAAQGCHSDAAALAVGACQRAASGLRGLGRRVAGVAAATATPAVYAARVALPAVRVPSVLDGPLTHARTSVRYVLEGLVAQGHATVASGRAEAAALLRGGGGSGGGGDSWSHASTPATTSGQGSAYQTWDAWDPRRDQLAADTSVVAACARFAPR
ncbi:MAG: hypothetical protein ACJ73S_26985 [Mycobacteriales bacterium]